MRPIKSLLVLVFARASGNAVSAVRPWDQGCPLARIDIPTEHPDLRGINVTPIIARTFERTVYQTFNKNNLEGYLNVSQFAYRTGVMLVLHEV